MTAVLCLVRALMKWRARRARETERKGWVVIRMWSGDRGDKLRRVRKAAEAKTKGNPRLASERERARQGMGGSTREAGTGAGTEAKTKGRPRLASERDRARKGWEGHTREARIGVETEAETKGETKAAKPAGGVS